MKKNHFPRVLQRLLMLVVVMMFAICANAATLAEAQACYDEVTAVGAKVDDADHNANYNALKALIDANCSDEAALQVAVDNCYRQYYYDKLATDVIVYTNYKKNFVEGDADQAALQAALDEAAKVYSDNIDLTKTPAEYKSAYENLEAVYTMILENQFDDALVDLKAQIDASTATVATLANVTEDNATTLNGNIANANVVYAKYNTTPLVPSVAGTQDLRTATTSLKNQTENIVKADLEQALAALNTAIATATNDETGTIRPVSTVVADELKGYIATAQGVYDETTTTALQAKAAKEQLVADQATADANFEAFKTAKTNLNDAITAANAITYSYTGVSGYLADAIAAAQAVYDAAQAKTTAELVAAKAALEAAETTAAATNAAANTLAGDITIAQDLVTKMDDAANIAAANAAIAAAQTALTVKANGATELATADQDLKDAVKGFYESNLTATKTALSAKITEAQDALNNTIAYTTDAHATALSDAITAAQTVLTGISTPADMTAATTTLNTAITTNVEADAQEAIDALTTAISTAQTQYAQRYITNQIYAEPLNTYVTEAQAVLASGTAKERKAKAEEYTTVNKSVTTNINSFLSACNTLNSTITKAKNYRDKSTKSTHVGVIEYLNDAIAVAENIVDINNTPVVSATMTTAEIKAANTTLKNAYNVCAKTANGYANSIEANVTSATDLINNTLVDDSYKTTLQNAIDAANASLLAKADAENNGAGLLTALNALQDAMYNCVNDDIADALKDLNDAITAANTAKATLAYDTAEKPNGTTLQTAIDAASAVAADATKTAKELVDATTALNTAKADVVAKDLQEATDALATAITDATTRKTELEALYTKLASYPDEQSKFNDAVIKPLVAAIATAQGVQDATTSTGAAKADQVDALAAAVTAANDALDLYYNTECQKLADVYTADKYLYNEVYKYVTVLTELQEFADAFELAENVYVSVKAKDGTKDVTDVINARAGLEKAYTDLDTAYKAWVAAADALKTAIDNANTEKTTEETQTEGKNTAIYDALCTAITTAQGVYDNKKTTLTADLTSATTTLTTALTTATTDNAAWVAAVKNLEDEIAVAVTTKAGLQACHQATTGATLQAAIDAANTVDGNKSATTTADLVTAYETLKAAVEAAVEDDTKWSFADATPDYKEGSYAAGNVTYTRSGAAIATGNYGSFCLPIEVATSNFANVYVPAPFAIYNEDSQTYKMFFKQVEDATIPANTAFLAELKSDGEIVLANEVAVDVTTPAVVAKTTIEVYSQSGTKSFVSYDKDTKFTWGGTLAKTTAVDGDLTFGRDGVIYKAGSYINPFRAFIHMEGGNHAAKVVVEFDEDEDATGIADLIMNAEGTNGKVYSVDGKYVGENVNGLAKGMYIVNGKKIVK